MMSNSPPSIQIPKISPLTDETDRPFWSIMVTSYQRTTYLAQCLESILAQDLGCEEMQIEVVDDCSPNQVEIKKLVQEIGRERISFYSSPKNTGIFANWNTCIKRAKGKWIHILSDDDLVLPGFYASYQRYAEQSDCGVVIGQSIIINEKSQWLRITSKLSDNDGILSDAQKILSKNNVIRTPGVVVSRHAYERIGGFTTDLVYAPDWEMWTRLAAHFKVAYANRPYSLFRIHSGSQTKQLILAATNVTDTLATAKIIQQRLGNLKDIKEARTALKRYLSKFSRSLSHDLLGKGFPQSALLHASWAFRLHPSWATFKNLLNISIKSVKFIGRPDGISIP